MSCAFYSISRSSIQFYFDHESFMLQTIAMLISVTVIIVRLPGKDIEFSI